MRFKAARSYFLNPFTGMVYFAFPQPSYSSVCDVSDICVGYIEQPLSAWYIWMFLLLLLIVIFRCLADCFLQWWIKKRRRFTSRKRVTIVTLSGLDSLNETEHLQHPYSRTWNVHDTLETSFSPLNLGGLQSGAPPSYDQLFAACYHDECNTSFPNQSAYEANIAET